jgi:MscS family membrane protein
VLLLVLLCALLGRGLHAQQAPNGQHRSPRATVRTLFTNISLAHAAPQRIEEAISCMDLSDLPANQQGNAGLLATQMEAVLRARDVDTEIIPEEVQGDVYVLPGEDGQRIGLRRMPDGRWLFDRETVAQIPRLYADAQKHLQEKNREAASLSVSPEHASPRATFRTLLQGARHHDSQRIVRCMDLNEIPMAARQEVGTQLADKLKQIMVRHRLPILQEIPDSNFSEPFVWLSQPEGVIELVRLPSGNRKGEWLLSEGTIRSIDRLYAAYENRPYLEEVVALSTTTHLPSLWNEPELWLRGHLPPWLRASILTTQHVRLEVYEVLGYILIPALAFGVYRLTTWLLGSCLRRLLVRRGWSLSSEVMLTRLRPVGRLAGVLFLRWGLRMLEADCAILVPLLVVLNPLVAVLGMWAAFRLIDLGGDLIEAHLATQKQRPEITTMLWPVGSLAVKIVLFALTLFHLMSLFSWDVTAVLTGLGIGGLAFALGAQDSLKNLFGSFTLIADRPFVVGESVKIGSHEVGVVEVVGLRSTRIRTGEDTLLIVPNSNLTTLEITNYGRRRYRRYLARLGVAYSTPPERLAAFRDGIQEVVRRHPCTRKDHFEVAVDDLAPSAIEIRVNVYFEVADRQQELEARDALILDVLRLADDINIELAFPTQTIHLVPPPERASQPAGQASLASSGAPSR